jgi:hypothetical protein
MRAGPRFFVLERLSLELLAALRPRIAGYGEGEHIGALVLWSDGPVDGGELTPTMASVRRSRRASARSF